MEEQLHRGRDKREDYHFILVILQPVDIKIFQYVNQLILVQYYLLFSELFLIILILKNHQPIDSSDDNDDKVNKADAAAKTKFSNYSFNSDDIGDIVEKFKTDLTNGLSASQYRKLEKLMVSTNNLNLHQDY